MRSFPGLPARITRPCIRAAAVLRACAFGVLLLPAAVHAQAGDGGDTPAAAYATGDAWLDGRLADIDHYAARYPEAFAAEVERHAGMPRAYVHGLLERPGWRAGDAWFACFLARALEHGCRELVRARSQAGAGAEWAGVAAAAGANDETLRALRLAVADSYRRWARPLHPDAALERALRQRQADAERKAEDERKAGATR